VGSNPTPSASRELNSQPSLKACDHKDGGNENPGQTRQNHVETLGPDTRRIAKVEIRHCLYSSALPQSLTRSAISGSQGLGTYGLATAINRVRKASYPSGPPLNLNRRRIRGDSTGCRRLLRAGFSDAGHFAQSGGLNAGPT
jgi:hypothetical protein